MREVPGTKGTTVSLYFSKSSWLNWVGRHMLWVTYFWLARESSLDHRGENAGSRSQQVTCHSWKSSWELLGAPRISQTQPLLSASPAPQPEGPPFRNSFFRGPHSGPLPVMPPPTVPRGISACFPQPPSRLSAVYPQTGAVRMLHLYHPIIAYKTLSVIFF